MMKEKILQVLLLSDSPSEVKAIQKSLEKSNFQINLHLANNENIYRFLLESENFNLIIAFYDFPFLSATNALKLALALQYNIPFICISGNIGEQKAVELMKQGAADVITTERINRLPSSVTRALKEAKIVRQLQRAKNQLHDKKIIKAQMEELRKVNDAKDRFFSIIAHDLKSPLNTLLGFSSILCERAKNKNYEDCERMADIIHQSSNNAVNLLSNLLSWAQTQIGSIEFQPVDFNFSEIAQQIIYYLNDTAHLKNIMIINELPPTVPVHADQDMIASVLRNLISNAVKFTHQGGKVTISCNHSAGELTVSVRDTGVGIPANRIQDLFQIGNTYSTYGTEKESGTGLGLILCREFIS